MPCSWKAIIVLAGTLKILEWKLWLELRVLFLSHTYILSFRSFGKLFFFLRVSWLVWSFVVLSFFFYLQKGAVVGSTVSRFLFLLDSLDMSCALVLWYYDNVFKNLLSNSSSSFEPTGTLFIVDSQNMGRAQPCIPHNSYHCLCAQAPGVWSYSI